MINPMIKFKSCWDEAKSSLKLKHPSAVCVSTIDEYGFPSGRFVDLKSVDESGFIFCTNLDSQKGRDIQRNPKVGLTFWWEAIGYQVRVNGLASQISSITAEKYWKTRSRNAQITTLSCKQSQPLLSEQDLYNQFEEVKKNIQDTQIPKPENWGGFIVKPMSIEFLTFKESRLHIRELYTPIEDKWQMSLLQP
ncbi:pyridoxamine 5'-phosphate oxidase [Heyndrickxia sp. NPDC080065]|uniref:pyridoxamine 5'-phosphate oxidase n=1 Tax=Heyndrickxia sp. NPDC080065 TaxID=3390568 RepID=UPI003D0277AC